MFSLFDEIEGGESDSEVEHFFGEPFVEKLLESFVGASVSTSG